jgi:hypothetical protein
MPTWLTFIMIVLVAVALSLDLRRNSGEELTDAAGHDGRPTATPDLLVRPNVRDVLENGHRGAVPRPPNVRRSGQDVRKHR